VARRTKEAAAITREQLLDAAEHVFRERGVAGSSLAEVAAEAGVTRGAVYWHFRDKADLYEAMCERATLPLETMLANAGATVHADPMAALRELALTALQRLAGDPRSQAVFEVMFHGSDRCTELGRATERKQRERRHCFLQVERILAQAAQIGQLPADTDVPLAAQALHAYIVGIMHEWVLDPDAFDLERAAAPLIDAMLAGLRAAPPRVASLGHRPRPPRFAPAGQKRVAGKA
jgi:TetR/AcrR family transcriptional regulator, acrAB operon repressor